MSSALTIDPGRCTACGRCELACAVEHSRTRQLTAALRAGDTPRPRVRVAEREGTPVPLVCIHCDVPACAAVCPAGAIEKQASGEVILFEERCVGCGACAIACHLGVPAVRRDGRAFVTCDLCPSRRAEGRPTACAEACPTGAITSREAGRGAVEYRSPMAGEGIYLVMTGKTGS